MIVYKAYFNPSTIYFRRSCRTSDYFYIIKCHKGRRRYIKIGTTERTIAARFNRYEYDIDEVLFVAEVKDCYKWEDTVRELLKGVKGFSFQRNDRFKYFQIPEFMNIIKNMVTENQI